MRSLADKLKVLEESCKTSEFFTLRELLKTLGSNSFGLLLLILSIPSAMPFPAPGISTPFGILNGLLAIQMLMGRAFPWLPEKTLNRKFKTKTLEKSLRFAIKIFKKIEYLTHPRYEFFISKKLLGVCILILACIMALPVPLTNSLPALIILILAVGLIESDGLWALFGITAGSVAVFGYLYLLYSIINMAYSAS